MRTKRTLVVLALTSIGLLTGADAPTEPVSGTGWSLLIEERQSVYPVEGRNIRELREQLRAHEAINEAEGHARTRSAFELLYDLYQHEGTCEVGGREIRVAITTRMPEWEPPGQVPPEILDRWDEAMARLALHEDGHRAQALGAAASLYDELSELAPEADCRAMRATISHKLRWIAWKLNVRGKRYDVRTLDGLQPDPLQTAKAEPAATATAKPPP